MEVISVAPPPLVSVGPGPQTATPLSIVCALCLIAVALRVCMPPAWTISFFCSLILAIQIKTLHILWDGVFVSKRCLSKANHCWRLVSSFIIISRKIRGSEGKKRGGGSGCSQSTSTSQLANFWKREVAREKKKYFDNCYDILITPILMFSLF